MRAKVLTLRFSPTLGRFDDAPLVSLQQKIVLEHVREHLVQVGDEAMLLCIATWREKVATGEQSQEPMPQPAAAPDAHPAANGTAETHRSAAPPVDELRASFTPDQQVLFDLLRRWRRQKARDEGVPGYVILTNRQLVEVVQRRPDSRTALAGIRGLGDKKLARHGAELLALLWPQAPAAEDQAAATPTEVANA